MLQKFLGIGRKHPIEIVREMDEFNKVRGSFSHTTSRFRCELIQYLLDNEARGPVIEVGTLNGGMTSLFAYVGKLTGRKIFGVDSMPHSVKATEETCRHFGVDADIFCGHLKDFLPQLTERPDLVFIDSDHSYDITLNELKVLHSQPFIPRCIVLHDFNYRQHHQLKWPREQNPIAVDTACEDFFSDRPKPIFKRIGGLSGDGTVNTPKNRGGLGTDGDYIKDFGSEGMMIFHP